MSNKVRERSDYRLELNEEQFEAFARIAKKRSQSIEWVVLEALDKFIETEKQSCLPPKS